MLGGCCCCDIVAIVISNSNSALDDNFEVFLNGTSLGAIDNSSSGVCTGRIFSTQAGVTCTNISPLTATTFCDSGICYFETMLTFAKTLLISGTNTLTIKSAPPAGLYTNFGKVKVMCLTKPDANFQFQKYLLDTFYSHGITAVGDVIFTSPFVYP